jgi:hypothetical protein
MPLSRSHLSGFRQEIFYQLNDLQYRFARIARLSQIGGDCRPIDRTSAKDKRLFKIARVMRFPSSLLGKLPQNVIVTGSLCVEPVSQ